MAIFVCVNWLPNWGRQKQTQHPSRRPTVGHEAKGGIEAAGGSSTHFVGQSAGWSSAGQPNERRERLNKTPKRSIKCLVTPSSVLPRAHQVFLSAVITAL